jgi:type II secretory pathway pseudopilin PulG
MLIVLAVIGVLSAIVAPNLGGFFSQSKEQSFDGDKNSIQSAVDGFRSANSNKLPVLATATTLSTATDPSSCPASTATSLDATTLANNCVLAINLSGVSGDLVDGAFLSKSPESASAINATSGTGSYTWYLQNDGQVNAFFDADDDGLFDTGDSIGFKSGVYP